MLPRKSVSDHELIVCVCTNRIPGTNNVHPLYLSPGLCWLNVAYVRSCRFRRFVFDVLKYASAAVVLAVLSEHLLRLSYFLTLDVLDLIWSFLVCASMIAGLTLTVLSSEKRKSCSASDVSVDPMCGVSLEQKLAFFLLFLSTHICTLMYYVSRGAEDSTTHMRVDNRGHRARSTLIRTALSLVWCNAVGFVRLRSSF